MDHRYSIILSLIHLESSKNEEYYPPPGKPRGPREALRDPPSVDPISKPGPPSKKTTEELTSEPNYDASSEPSVPTMEDSLGHIYP